MERKPDQGKRSARLTREDVVSIVYGQPKSPIQRFTQDSPVLADVWIAYAQNPREPQDLLLTPYQSALALPSSDHTQEHTLLTPGRLAKRLKDRLEQERRTARWKTWARDGGDRKPDIAYNQTTVAARLWFDELVRVVLPMSHWYATRIRTDVKAARRQERRAPANMVRDVAVPRKRSAFVGWLTDPETAPPNVSADVLWALQVIGTIALAHDTAEADAADQLWPPPEAAKPRDRQRYYARIVAALATLIQGLDPDEAESEVYLVSLNRRVETTMWRSTVAVKADAATRLFDVSCRDLTWAIIDSGIDATHPAFRRFEGTGTRTRPFRRAFVSGSQPRNNTRIVGTFDFTVIRRLLSMDDGDEPAEPAASRQKARAGGRLRRDPQKRKQLRESLNSGREIDWSLLMDLIALPGDDVPEDPHGTHVAGILGADWRFDEDGQPLQQPVKGMCPDINLYDLRVLGPAGGDEFSVMAALQFVRFLNLHREIMAVHGVNLSLSIQHDVLNYACGRTPVCEECTRLIGAGVVVVAAAGNEGYQTMPASLGSVTRNVYQSISITDPGNAEAVITVGATHRDSPHTFGVSYFSSRGPTGDGRCKPDLVAPGEKIESTVPGGARKRMDGTSMAAPHVSGAAALLIARHRELLGSPQRIKEILCRTATDLGRERYFQGSGMIDVLRALQSV
jgi:subtilisin family serine protease